jgi:DNA-binding SARP family transcriptional activator/tetratricopeptide (TPR) repeat protein
MDYRILGPLEVSDDTRAVALGGARARELLAIFVLQRNQVVPLERLCEHLYGANQPATGAKSIQAHISRLRRSLGADVLRTRAGGYVLEVDPDDVDADRFARLLAAGRAAATSGDAPEAERSLSAALALWRGSPLSDLAYHDVAQPEIARLEDLRLACVEELVDARLSLGRHAEAVVELERLVVEHPLRERLVGQLMLALYRDGRQADALATYQVARAALVDQLGIEPGRRLRELQRAILRQAHELDFVESEAPGDPPGGLVGREDELGALVMDFDEAATGRGRVVLVTGEPGIGKSRLAEELVAHARGRGAEVLVGRCWEAGGAPAYWPWVQALRSAIQNPHTPQPRARLGHAASDLVPVLPELRELLPELPEPFALDSDGARFRLFEGVAAFLRALGEGRPVVLVLDDLHAADAPSLLTLRFVARDVRVGRVLILGLFRDVDPTMSDPLASTVGELLREPHVRQLALQGLSLGGVGSFIELAAERRPAPEVVSAIHAETDGNPLFVGEVVRLLDTELRLVGTESRLRIPPGLRAVIGQRVRRLSPTCQELLVPAAVLGREFGLDALARLSDMPAQAVVRTLDEAMTERVVGEVPGASGRLRFSHALIRDTLYDELTLFQRMEWHLRAGEALERAYAADPAPHLAELALHFHAAGPIGGAEKAIEYAARAGDRAGAQLAFEEAVRLYGLALTLAEESAVRGELLLALGEAQARSGEADAARATFREASALAERQGSADQLGRAALGYGGRITWGVSRDDDTLAELLERALVPLGESDTALRARVLARLAGGPLRDSTSSPLRRAELSAEALDIARRLGDPSVLAYALAGYISAHHSPQHTFEQVRLATELVDAALEAGDLERAVEGYEHRAEGRLELGDMRGAKADVDEMARVAAKLRQPSQDWFVAEIRAHHALLEGRFDEAERLIAAAFDLGRKAESWSATVSHGLQLYMLRRHQGRLAEIEQDIRRSVAAYPTYPIWRCVFAHMTATLGQQSESRAAFDALAADSFGAIPMDEMWLGSMSFLAETAALLGHEGGASTLHASLLPYEGRVAVATPEISAGSVARYLGLLAMALGRWVEADRHLAEAVETNERIGARPWLAHAQEEHARTLFARGGQVRAARAERLSLAAAATFAELGMHDDAARASRQARQQSSDSVGV